MFEANSLDLQVALWVLLTTDPSSQLPASTQHRYRTKCMTPSALLCSTSVWVWGAAEGDPLLLGAPFVVVLLTVLRREEERPSLTVGHAPVLLATTGPEDADLPGLYWLGSQLAVAALAPVSCPIQGPGRPFIKALKAAE